MDLVFLTGHLPGFNRMAKRFTANGVLSYPMMSKVTSHHETVAAGDFNARLALYQHYAGIGAGLLGGPLQRPLVKESRAGLVVRDADTERLVLDIDGFPHEVPTTFDAPALRQLARIVIDLLPPFLAQATPLIHASSSLGVKPGKISLHLEYILDKALTPKIKREFMKALNLNIAGFKSQLKLSATGSALRWLVDPALAENSRALYIAPPGFEDGLADPFPDPADRFALLDDQARLVSHDELRLWLTTLPDQYRAEKTLLSELRREAGLSRRTFRTQRLTTPDGEVHVVVNPEQAALTPDREYEHYVTYNVAGGDSGAYYVAKNSPAVVRNWKGEPPFSFAAADPDAYAAHLKTYGNGTDSQGRANRVPMVFHDKLTDSHWAGQYNPDQDRFEELNPCVKPNLANYLLAHGQLLPDPIPEYRMIFDPTNATVLDRTEGVVNSFSLPQPLAELVPLAEELQGLPGNDLLSTLQVHTPTIAKVLLHACGGGQVEANRFLNWLAYILQTRRKAKTAWLLHGTQGTGKGLINEHILQWCFENYYHVCKTENFADQFNEWIGRTVMVVLEEFRAGDSKAEQALAAKIRTYITDAAQNVRIMRTDQKTVTNYINIVAFSNEHDVMRIEDGCRRWNICPRQEIPLKRVVPDTQTLKPAIVAQRGMFVAILMSCKADQTLAETPLENAAKDTLRNVAQDSIGEFVTAVNNGDLRYFDCLMFSKDPDSQAARNHFQAWVRDAAEGRPSIIWTEELLPAFLALCSERFSVKKFTSMCRKRGLRLGDHYRQGGHRQGIEVRWNVTSADALHLLQLHFPSAQAQQAAALLQVPSWPTTQ